ncbi:hypothetical protein [Sinorhizobium sp. A49]|uniref:hypothetical protein n=1 Tax=Sinorhizobium sp. A49 TaxID=1945861 RepID=UPI0015C55C0F|nr:hypothetical protein [Sinorhizobium sp. A49]
MATISLHKAGAQYANLLVILYPDLYLDLDIGGAVGPHYRSVRPREIIAAL